MSAYDPSVFQATVLRFVFPIVVEEILVKVCPS